MGWIGVGVGVVGVFGRMQKSVEECLRVWRCYKCDGGDVVISALQLFIAFGLQDAFGFKFVPLQNYQI